MLQYTFCLQSEAVPLGTAFLILHLPVIDFFAFLRYTKTNRNSAKEKKIVKEHSHGTIGERLGYDFRR